MRQGHNGNYRVITASGRTRALARAALQIKILQQTSGTHTMTTLAEAYQTAAERRGSPKPKTVLEHRDTFRRHIVPVFGDRHPASLTRAQINVYLGSFVGISPRPMYDTLRVLFREALQMGIVDVDPTTNAFNFTTPTRNPTALLDDVLERIEAAFEAEREYLSTKDKHPATVRDVELTLRDTGLRIGEALALRKQDYDPKTRRLSVAGTMTTHATSTGLTSIRQPSGKTSAATRTVTLPAGAERGLSASDILLERFYLASTPDSPLFPSRAGTFLSTANFRRRWRDALRRNAPELYPADKEHQVHPHLVRHTVATAIVREAVERYGYAEGMERARLQLGHATTKPLVSYIDRSRLAVDNSDLLTHMNPANSASERVAAAVNAIASESSAAIQGLDPVDGLPAFVIHGGDATAVIHAIDERFAGLVVVVTEGDPRLKIELDDTGSPWFEWATDVGSRG